MLCDHNIPETKKGTGPCQIETEVRKRNGKQLWWCRTHGQEASAPDGAPLKECPAAWFDAVPDDMQIEIDLSAGQFALWGVVPPAISVGEVPLEPGKVHVHYRAKADAEKELDRSFEIVRIRLGDATAVIEGMAAQAYALSDLSGMQVLPLKCSHCGETHIDELMFATHPHKKHQCNGCGRNFWHSHPSISNPLGGVRTRLGMAEPSTPRRVDRHLDISSHEYAGIALWPSNRAIITTMSRPEDEGIHVHAWSESGCMEIDDTFSPVFLDGEEVNEELLRVLAVQRAIATHDDVPIIALACDGCGQSLISPTKGWVQPTTRHKCDSCGTENRTRRRSFLNPLANKST